MVDPGQHTPAHSVRGQLDALVQLLANSLVAQCCGVCHRRGNGFGVRYGSEQALDLEL